MDIENRDHEPVICRALCLLSFDGDPETDGAEYYAPAGYEPEEPFDAEGRPLTDLPSAFVTTRIQAEAMVKAGAVQIEDDIAAG